MGNKTDAFLPVFIRFCNSRGMRMVSTLICSFMLFVVRIVITPPLILCVGLGLTVLFSIPVAVFISPSFTPDTLLADIARVKLFVLYVPLCIAVFLFELVVLLRRITCFWAHDAGMGRGR